MSKFYVYSTVPIVYPSSSRYGKDKVFPTNTRFVVLHFDGKACEVKPAGKGNYRTTEVATNLLIMRVAITPYGPVVYTNLDDFFAHATFSSTTIWPEK